MYLNPHARVQIKYMYRKVTIVSPINPNNYDTVHIIIGPGFAGSSNVFLLKGNLLSFGSKTLSCVQKCLLSSGENSKYVEKKSHLLPTQNDLNFLPRRVTGDLLVHKVLELLVQTNHELRARGDAV